MSNLKSKYFDFYDVKLEQFVFQTIAANEGGKVKLRSLDYDIDFDVLTRGEPDKIEGRNMDFVIKLKIVVNRKKKPGYFIQANFIMFFKLRNFRQLSEDVINQYIIFTALPMAINSARMELAMLTSHGFLGQYFLPPVDMKALLATQEEKQ